jgi:iron complex outermembrane receptor protein
MNRHTFVSIFTLISISASLGMVPGLSLAQGAVLEEIIVTARQREERLQDVPSTITAFTSGTIERAGIQRAEDFIALTPGVSMVDAAEVGDAQISIRGINGTRDAEANFAFIVDGILHTNPSAFNREFADLQQIEIVKGPQSAIYGRSASSGAVIVTTAKPGDEVETKIKLSAGNDSSYYASGAVSGPISEGELYGRIHVDYRTTDGFYSNSFQGDTDIVDDFENYNINGRMIWEPSDNLSVDIHGHHGEVDAASITFNAAFALSALEPVFGTPIFEDVNQRDFVFQGNVDPSNEQESTDFSIKVDYDMEWADLTGWFLYSNIEQAFTADGTSASFSLLAGEQSCIDSVTALGPAGAGVALPAPTFIGLNPGGFDATFNPTGSFLGPYTPTTCDGYQNQTRDQEDISFELRLASKGDQQLRWQAGVYYLDLEREVGVATLREDVSGSLPKSLINAQTEALVYDGFDTSVLAVFGQIAYDVTDNLEISAALRYDREERKVQSLVPGPNQQTSNFIDYTAPFLIFPLGANVCDDGVAGSPLNPAFIDFATCTVSNSIPDREETFKEVQPKISASWSVTEESTLFANWGVGFKSGGFNNQGSAATIDLFFNTPLLDPVAFGGAGIGAGLSITDNFRKETSSAFEVGFKSRFADGRLNLEGALYHTKVDDMQIFNFFVGPFGLLRVVSNIDEVTIQGVELAGSFQVTDAISIFGGFGITDTEIDVNTNRPQTVGNKVPYAPDYTANVGAELYFPAFDNVNFVARIDYSIVGPTWFSTVQADDPTPNLFTPFGFGPASQNRSQRDDYGLLNIRAGLEGEKWGVNVFAKNLTNENYLEEVIPAPEFGGSFIHPGSEQSWGVEVTYDF